MTNETKRALRKRLLELAVAALTALLAALTTSCAFRWSKGSIAVEPLGTWHWSTTNGPTAGK